VHPAGLRCISREERVVHSFPFVGEGEIAIGTLVDEAESDQFIEDDHWDDLFNGIGVCQLQEHSTLIVREVHLASLSSSEARKLFAGAVRFLHRIPRVHIEAPLNVESVVTDDPAARLLRIHLIAYQSPPQTISAKQRPFIFPALVEEAPLYRVAVESAEPFAEAAALNSSTVLKTGGRRVEALVNDIHEVLLLRH